MSTNALSKLKVLLYELNALLSEYISIHDKVLQESSALKSLFKRVNFKGLFEETNNIHNRFIDIQLSIDSMRNSLLSELNQNQVNLFEAMSKYTQSLCETTRILSSNMEASYKRSENTGKLGFVQFMQMQKKYRQSINDYMKKGNQLNELYNQVFGR